MQKFTKMPVDAFQKLQLNAGILVDTFDPATGTIGNILGATSGGINFNSNPTYSDFGEDVDNCPANMKELKHLDSFDPQMSGTFLTCTPAVLKDLVAAADVDADDTTRVVPRAELIATDFKDLWWIGDYSDQNTGDNAGYLAIHLMNALNQTGFQIQSGKNAKGTMSFEYHGHYSMAAQETVPFEIYCKGGSDTSLPYIALDRHAIKMKVGDTFTFTVMKSPDNASVTWTSSATAKASVSSGTVTAAQAGTTIITAAITVDSVTYNDTCTVIVEAAS